jgi:hypothetical protein
MRQKTCVLEQTAKRPRRRILAVVLPRLPGAVHGGM